MIKCAYKKGFLLIEVVLALVLLGSISTLIGYWYKHNLEVQKLVVLSFQADALATAFIEHYRAYRFSSSQIKNNNFMDTILDDIKELLKVEYKDYNTFKLDYDISDMVFNIQDGNQFQGFSSMKIIRVIVRWVLNNKSYSYSLSTGL